MPNCHTFKIKPVKELIEKYVPQTNTKNFKVIDPFANESKYGNITNDISYKFDTNYHMDATDFLKLFSNNSIDFVLYDPPYSSRQVSECYKNSGYTVNMETTQSSC